MNADGSPLFYLLSFNRVCSFRFSISRRERRSNKPNDFFHLLFFRRAHFCLAAFYSEMTEIHERRIEIFTGKEFNAEISLWYLTMEDSSIYCFLVGELLCVNYWYIFFGNHLNDFMPKFCKSKINWKQNSLNLLNQYFNSSATCKQRFTDNFYTCIC